MAEEGVTPREPAGSAQQASPGPIVAFGRTLNSVVDVGRELLARRRRAQQQEAEPEPARSADVLASRCEDLLEHRGEASGLALASEIVSGYQQLPVDQRLPFFERLARDFEVDRDAIFAAVERYREADDLDSLWSLGRAVEAPRQKLFRRINTAPEGTRTLVTMRGHLLELLRDNPGLRGVEADLKTLFISWFNKIYKASFHASTSWCRNSNGKFIFSLK